MKAMTDFIETKPASCEVVIEETIEYRVARASY